MSVNQQFLATRPVSPICGYVGGKRILSKKLVSAIASVDHDVYAEAFVGMGGVFFRRESVPKSEIINDGSRDVTNLFRILQRHYPAFMDYLRFSLSSRAEFERLSQTDPDTLTDLERAGRFLYLQRLTFGGKVTGRSFGLERKGTAGFNINRLAPLLDEVHSRLSSVTIECMDFEQFLLRYDRPGTLFYLDPPYVGTEHYYGKDLFSKSDSERLAEVLAGLKGRFILTNSDCEKTRYLFRSFNQWTTPVSYSVQGQGKLANRHELIVSNTDISSGLTGDERVN